MMPIRHFVGFSAEPAQITGEFLLSLADSSAGITDLTDTLLVLPGRSAVRNVTAALMQQAEKLFPPSFRTPGSLLKRETSSGEQTASAAEQQFLWQRVLSGLDQSRFGTLFRFGYDPADEIQLRHLAAQFATLRKTLTDHMHSMASAAEIFADSGESDRWDELAALEQLFLTELSREGLGDPLTELLNTVADTAPFAAYRHIVLAALPDIPPAARRLLENLKQSGTCQIHILVFAPSELQVRFDEWGCVIPEAWSGYPLDFGEPTKALHVARNPEHMAQMALDFASADGAFDPATDAVAVVDPNTNHWLKKTFSSAFPDLEIHDPAGVTMDKLRIAPLLSLLADLLNNAAYPEAGAVRPLFVHSGMLRFLADGQGQDELLKELDQYYADHLPETIRHDSPEPPPRLKKAFDVILEIRHDLLTSTAPVQTLRDILQKIFPAEVTPPPMLGISFGEEVRVVREMMGDFERSYLLSKIPAKQCFTFFTDQLCTTRAYAARNDAAMDLTGFLELPFRPGIRRLILCGMNDGSIPEVLPPDPFLSNRKRGRLGIPDNALRYARDCFYLASLLAVYPDIHFISCRTDDDGLPLRFPALYFAGADDFQMLQRLEHLYRQLPPADVQTGSDEGTGKIQICPEWEKIFLEKDGVTPRFSVTDFKELLLNPVQAVFSRSFRMEELDVAQVELDARVLGTMCHDALEKFDSQKETDDELVARFESGLAKQFGRPLPLPVKIQAEMFIPRLKHAAPILRESDKLRKKIFHEWKLNDGKGIMFRGALIKGKIDRIEISHDGQEIRLIDFKTSDSGKAPEADHWQPGNKRFTNLQLPLYQLLLPLDETFLKAYRELFPENDPASIRFVCGYFVLPKAVTNTGYSMWEITPSQLGTAALTAEKVIRLVAELWSGNFSTEWADLLPPAKDHAILKNWYDAYAKLVLPTVEDAIGNLDLNAR